MPGLFCFPYLLTFVKRFIKIISQISNTKPLIMKRIKLQTALFICCSLLLAASCKKDKGSDDGLPPLTFEGKSTIGAKINGVPWVPKGISGPGGITYPTSGGYYAVFNTPLIHIWIKTNDPGGRIDLYVNNYNNYNYLPVGRYVCDKNTNTLPFGSGVINSYCNYWVNNNEYKTDNLHKGWIEILKSDSVNKIISGRFEFEGYNATAGKTYRITEGRFDYRNH